MKVSKLNKRIQFKETKKIQTPAGSIKEQEVVVYECWAAIKEQYVKDVQATLGTILEGSVVFIIRSAYKPKTIQKIAYEGAVYEIIKVVEDTQGKKYTTVLAKKKGV